MSRVSTIDWSAVGMALAPVLKAMISDALDDRDRRQKNHGMLDQSQSNLGRRRHINLVRRLHAEGDERVVIVGRKYLATPEAIDEEWRRLGKAPKRHDAELAELAAECGLKLVGGGRR